MKPKISAALLCLLLASPADAQNVDALARQYMELPAVQASLRDMRSSDLIGRAIAAQLRPDVRLIPAKKAAISKVVAQKMAEEGPMIEKAMIESAAKTYTAEELKAMIAFASTKTGASATRKCAAFALTLLATRGPITRHMDAVLEMQIRKILLQ